VSNARRNSKTTMIRTVIPMRRRYRHPATFPNSRITLLARFLGPPHIIALDLRITQQSRSRDVRESSDAPKILKVS
jgi:hypothetical protein